MDRMKGSRMKLLCMAVAIVSIVLSVSAVCTPGWQTFTAKDSRLNAYVEAGLWRFCQTSLDSYRARSCDNVGLFFSELQYFYTVRYSGFTMKAIFYPWYQTVFWLICAALALSFAACLTSIPYISNLWPRITPVFSIIFTALLALSALLHFIPVAMFLVKSQQVEYDRYIGFDNTYLKSLGYSFFLETTAFILALVAFILALIAVVRRERNRSDQNDAYPMGPGYRPPDGFVVDRETGYVYTPVKAFQSMELQKTAAT